MQHIQAIICFNGGSVGDLVKKLSLLCYDIETGIVNDSGMVDLPQYFKIFFKSVWDNKRQYKQINWNKIFPIENSHYYFEYYNDIAKNVYYIDYEDSVNPVILSEFLRKRFNHDWQLFLGRHIKSLPLALQDKVNESNYQQVFEIQWLKNLRGWRANPKLQPINFYDLLQRDTMISVVERITERNILDINKFDSIYAKWAENNSTFLKLIQ